MLIATNTVTINAAFLQEIKEDDTQLRALLAEVRTMCEARPPQRIPARRFAALLAELRDQLAMHFALEEAYGYFDEPVSVAPHLSECAESLRKQHGSFYKEVSRLTKTADYVVSCNGSFRGLRNLACHVLDFQGRLQEHEEAENDLIVQAYNVDIGGGD